MISSNLIIAALTACSAGIFAWLFLLRFYDSLSSFQTSYTENTSSRLSELFYFVDLQKIFPFYVVALLVFPLLTWIISDHLLLGLVMLILLLFAPHMLLSHLHKKRIKTFEKQLPDALAMLSGSLKVGASLDQAMDTVITESEAPLSQEFSLFLRERKLGVELNVALNHLEQRIELEDLSLLLAAIKISREVGGNLADTLDNLADTLRRKLVMEGKIDSLTAQGKLQGIVMSFLPMLLAGVLMKLEPKAMGMLFTTKIGWMTIAVIATLQILGFVSIRKITRIDV
jgi:tight adherence protein B